MRKIKAQLSGRVPELSELIKTSKNRKYYAIKGGTMIHLENG